MDNRNSERTVSPNEGAALFKTFVDKRREFLALEAEAKLAYSRLAKEKMPGADAYEKLAAAKAAISDRFHESPTDQTRARWKDRLQWLRAVVDGQGKRKSAIRIRRRAGKPKTPRPLTARQAEVVQVVGECKGDIAAAARRLGRDRKTIEEAYSAAMKKLGKEAVKHGTRTLTRDRRRQIDLSAEDDRRG